MNIIILGMMIVGLLTLPPHGFADVREKLTRDMIR
jgi:hypothetical protein